MLPTISIALNRVVQIAEEEKNTNNPHWWKIIEASATAIGLLREYIIKKSKNKRKNVILHEFLTYTKSMLGQGGNGAGYQGDVSPFLHGRCLWALSRYVDVSPDFHAILNCVNNNLSESKPMVVQISAITAFHQFCIDLRTMSTKQQNMIIGELPNSLNFITNMAGRVKASELLDVLSSVEEAVLKVRSQIDQNAMAIENSSSSSKKKLLWEFLLEILIDDTHKNIIRWINKDGTFKLIDPQSVAEEWGKCKGKTNMTYDKLSRSLRNYYDEPNPILKKGQRNFEYKFICNLKSITGYDSQQLFNYMHLNQN